MGRGVLLYLGMVGMVQGDDPHFLLLLIQFGPYFIMQPDPHDPLFLQK